MSREFGLKSNQGRVTLSLEDNILQVKKPACLRMFTIWLFNKLKIIIILIRLTVV